MSDPHVGTTSRVQMKRWWRAYIVAITGIFGIYAAVVTVLASSGAPLNPLEYVVLFVLFVTTAAALVNGMQAGRSLEHSVARLESLRSGGDPGGKGGAESPSWLSDCEARLNERIRADWDAAAGWRNATLPGVAGIVDGVRSDADRAGHVLRWFSQAAVLVGLMGTLIGLIGAIGHSIAALKVKGEFGDGIGMAMQGLEFCFVSSILGVATSFFLGWARQAYEAAADSHFSDLEHWFQTRIRVLYVGWADPLLQFCAAAEKLVVVGAEIRQVGTDIKNLSQTIKDNTTEVLEGTVNFFGTELQAQLPKIADSVSQGLRDGTAEVMRGTKEQQQQFLNKYAEQYTQFAEKYADLQREAQKHLAAQRDEDGKAREHVLADLSTARTAVQQAGSDLLDSVRTCTTGQQVATSQFIERAQQAAADSAGLMREDAAALKAAVESLILDLKSQRAADEQRGMALTEAIQAASGRIQAASNALAGSTEQVASGAQLAATNIANTLVNAVDVSAQRARDATASLINDSDARIAELAASRLALLTHADSVLKEVAAKLENANAGTYDNIEKQRGVNEQLATKTEAALSSLATALAEIKTVVLASEQNTKNAIESTAQSAKVAERMENVRLSLDGLGMHIRQLVHVDEIEHEAFIEVVNNLIDQMARNAKQVD